MSSRPGSSSGRWINPYCSVSIRNPFLRYCQSERYPGGWIDPRGGAIQPLAYARGLARAALKAGARLHGGSRVVGLWRHGGKRIAETHPGGRETADRAIVCTNGYTDNLVPGLLSMIIAPNSFQIATEPLSSNVARSILPEGHVSSDTRRLLFYFRLDHQDRLLRGGRGSFREPTRAADWAHLERAVGQPRMRRSPTVGPGAWS